MSFDLEKMQAVAELGEVIRLQNEALERLVAFRKSRPYLMMPNLAKMVEENIKENVTVLYKELNNLHKPAAQQTRYICKECKMAFVVALPGGICDECRARLASQPRNYALPVIAQTDEDDLPEDDLPEESQPAILDAPANESENEAEEAAEDVAHDLSVAEPVETPVSESEVSENEVEDVSEEEENVYELSMDDDEDIRSDSESKKDGSES